MIVPYVLVWLARLAPPPTITSVAGFNASLTMLFPFVQGLALAVALGPKRYGIGTILLLVLALTVIEILGAYVFMREGVICLIILSPLIYGLMLLGALLGRLFARGGASRTVQASLIPLVVFAVFAEASGPKPDHTSAVTDSVTISAPAEYVWRYVLSYPQNNAAPEYWLWRAGLPEPIQSVAEAPRVGAGRVCMFSDGLAFEERITELEPNRLMTFDVTKQPDHPEVIGHFQFDRGQIRLTPNADGSTTVTATSWYRLFVRPAAYFDYFDWWTADITRQVHFSRAQPHQGIGRTRLPSRARRG
ncbi:MAG: SRPBCC family protein [Terricaulis sp.]